jgi:hypothetical protein
MQIKAISILLNFGFLNHKTIPINAKRELNRSVKLKGIPLIMNFSKEEIKAT